MYEVCLNSPEYLFLSFHKLLGCVLFAVSKWYQTVPSGQFSNPDKTDNLIYLLVIPKFSYFFANKPHDLTWMADFKVSIISTLSPFWWFFVTADCSSWATFIAFKTQFNYWHTHFLIFVSRQGLTWIFVSKFSITCKLSSFCRFSMFCDWSWEKDNFDVGTHFFKLPI